MVDYEYDLDSPPTIYTTNCRGILNIMNQFKLITGYSGKDVQELASLLINLKYITENDVIKNTSGHPIYSTRLEEPIAFYHDGVSRRRTNLIISFIKDESGKGRGT